MKRIPLAKPIIGRAERRAVNDCLMSGWISSRGQYIERFENAFAAYTGTTHAISACNGTVTLHLILLALGVKKGDEVIVPTFTYVASVNAILYVGATPVFVDCDPHTYAMDPEFVAKKISKRTKAIMVVHLYGNLCDMHALESISTRTGVPIIEDAAEAHGADYGTRKAGSFGIASSFSFFGNKTMTTGEGGMVCTRSTKLAARIRLLKNQGQSPTRRYYHPELGYNYRMTNIEAAIGLAQLESLDRFVATKRKIRTWYGEELDSVDGIKFQIDTPSSRSSYWMTALTLRRARPSDVAHDLEKQGIETRPFFVPMHRAPYVVKRGVFPHADRLSRTGIVLPTALTLTRKDVQLVGAALRDSLKRHS